jgi:hypothetical protein
MVEQQQQQQSGLGPTSAGRRPPSKTPSTTGDKIGGATAGKKTNRDRKKQNANRN